MATWTDPTGAAVTIYSVDGTAGIMTLDNSDNEGTQVLAGLSVEECEITFDMDWVTGAGGTITPGVYYRAASDLSTFFKVMFTIDLDPLTNDTITGITVASEEGTIGTASVSKVHTVGVPFRTKVRSTTNHFVKVWNSNVAEPASWDLIAGGGADDSGTVGLTAGAALDSPVPEPLENVLWMFGAEQGMTGFGVSQITGPEVLIGTSSSNVGISSAGEGRDGAGYAARFNLSSTTGYIEVAGTTIVPVDVSQFTTTFSFRFVNALPTGGSSGLVLLLRITPVSLAGIDISLRLSDAAIVVVPSNNLPGTVVAGPVLTTNTWYTVEAAVDMSTSTFTINWSVNGVAQTQATRAGVVSPPKLLQSLRYGPSVGNTTCNILYDDLLYVRGIDQYPLGDIKIVRIMPSATITESGTANVWCRFTSNGGGLDTTFNAANILAAISVFPPATTVNSSGTGVYQRTAGLSVGAITVPFDTYSLQAGQGVGAVRLETILWQSTNGGSDFRVLGNVGGSNTVLWNATGQIVFNSQVWACKIYTPAEGWSQSTLNAFAAVIDGGADISPLPGYRFVMAEVAIRTASGLSSSTIDVEFDNLQVCSCEAD